jgi:predicted transcriptional regulator
MSTVKEEVKQLVERLPEDVTWADVMYEVYVRQKLEAGLKASDEGRVVPHEEVKKRFLAR